MFKDEIEELKDNLERKEYLLQVNEQRYGEYEKILMSLADEDEGLKKKLAKMNLIPKDRKISNVVLENNDMRENLTKLQYENERLRDQMEQLHQQKIEQHPEELSIFQAKAPTNLPTVDFEKMKQAEQDNQVYIAKLEQSVQYLNEKIQKSRIDYKNLKKENHNLKDSNENHIFINEKLNQALKKQEQRINDLEAKLSSEEHKTTSNTSGGSSEKVQ